MEDLVMVYVRKCSACFCRDRFYNFGSTYMKMLFIVQSLSCVQLFETPWPIAHQTSLSITVSWSLLKLMPMESVMTSNHLVLCFPLLLLPSIFPSTMVFLVSWLFASRGQSFGATASVLVLSMNIQVWFPLGLTGLISLLSKGLSRVFHHHSLKASIFWCSAFLMVHEVAIVLSFSYQGDDRPAAPWACDARESYFKEEWL